MVRVFSVRLISVIVLRFRVKQIKGRVRLVSWIRLYCTNGCSRVILR